MTDTEFIDYCNNINYNRVQDSIAKTQSILKYDRLVDLGYLKTFAKYEFERESSIQLIIPEFSFTMRTVKRPRKGCHQPKFKIALDTPMVLPRRMIFYGDHELTGDSGSLVKDKTSVENKDSANEPERKESLENEQEREDDEEEETTQATTSNTDETIVPSDSTLSRIESIPRDMKQEGSSYERDVISVQSRVILSPDQIYQNNKMMVKGWALKESRDNMVELDFSANSGKTFPDASKRSSSGSKKRAMQGIAKSLLFGSSNSLSRSRGSEAHKTSQVITVSNSLLVSPNSMRKATLKRSQSASRSGTLTRPKTEATGSPSRDMRSPSRDRRSPSRDMRSPSRDRRSPSRDRRSPSLTSTNTNVTSPGLYDTLPARFRHRSGTSKSGSVRSDNHKTGSFRSRFSFRKKKMRSTVSLGPRQLPGWREDITTYEENVIASCFEIDSKDGRNVKDNKADVIASCFTQTQTLGRSNTFFSVM